MKKFLIILSLLLSASLAACSEAEKPSPDAATTESDRITDAVTESDKATEPATEEVTSESATEQATEWTTDSPEETTAEEIVPMIQFTSEDIVDARLVVDAYRPLLNEALSEANLSYAITTDGSDTGFDAVVVATMERTAYVVNVTETGILVRAGHYLSLEAAFKEILAGRGLDGKSFAGEYDGDVPLSMEEMVLVWNEEFTGDTLDPAKWALKAKMNQGDILNSTDEKNVMVTDGVLLLRSWREEAGAERPYSTNTSVTTDGTLSYQYGYLEMSAIVPYQRGAWPSFWLLGSDLHKVSDYRAEVDVLEVFGSINEGYSQLHKALLEPYWINYQMDLYTEDERGFRFNASEVKKLKTEYHRYGFGWTPTQMYFTLDGEVYFTHDITEAGNFGEGDMSCFHDPLFIIFNNFLFTDGSSWQPNKVSSKTDFPIEYRIDWVRLYQTPGEGALYYDGYAK